MFSRIVFILVLVGCLTNSPAKSQRVDVFNLGRMRCFTGGFTLTADDRTILSSQTHKQSQDSPLRLKIFTSTWTDRAWSQPTPLIFSDYHEFGPVLSPDGNTLYFSSTSPAPGETEEGDVNIWFVEKYNGEWGKPAFAQQLNTNDGDRVSFVDQSGKIYFVSGRSGNLDVYVSRRSGNDFDAPQPVNAWNTELDEEYVSINKEGTTAFIQRTRVGESTEILYSTRSLDNWQSPASLLYPGRFTQLPYVHKWPRLSNDGSTLFLISQGLIYQMAFKEVATNNALGIDSKTIGPYKPLAIAPRLPQEPEPFGGLVLKTNNGISFTPDGKTVYLSRYTTQRDTSGGQYIKIFESKLTKQGWSAPVQVPFMNAQAPYEYHPVLSPDGKRLFYNTRAATPGANVSYYRANNIWMVERSGDGLYSKPVMIDILATDHYDDYSSATRNGTLYFRSDRPGGKGSGDIYRSTLVNGNYQPPVPFDAINSSDNENDVCVDPDERFIIFNRYIDPTKEIKLFLSVRVAGQWTAPRVIDPLEKATDWELTPSLSPDGRYFFYEVNSNILRVPVAELFTPEERRAMAKG